MNGKLLGSSRRVKERRWIIAVTLVLLSGVVSPVRAMDEKSIQGFREALMKLGPDVDPAEAELVSTTAHHTARHLAREYRVVGPAVFQNFLIHIGAREKGFC